MAETAISSTVNVVIRLVEFGLAYSEVSSDTRQLLDNIELADRKVTYAKRLRRIKSGYLEQHLKHDVDADIRTAENAVNSIGQTIEGCRADLETNNKKVKPLNKLKWLFRDGSAFRSQGWTLSNALAALISDISLMDNVQPPARVVEPPPRYDQVTNFRGQLRSPTLRRKLAKQRSESSLADPEANANANEFYPVHTHDGHLSTGDARMMDFDYTYPDYRIDNASDDDRSGRRQVPVETAKASVGLWSNMPWKDIKAFSANDVVELDAQTTGASKPRRLRSACIR